jgi:hypothetical protein
VCCCHQEMGGGSGETSTWTNSENDQIRSLSGENLVGGHPALNEVFNIVPGLGFSGYEVAQEL